ncbi:hypothetical protein [Catenuloplanes atrovinosus]|uniref:Uncharacterized protein n=1 Tax=Catenuloplanes atrovinosus TaxID=137266 RepID=A0AAE3YVR7_9ACTN|nr:hypothetical protein [Catenuloplanes atrovinosus]MDR7278916.1 hypothetical protein [Catenuloplanes atrovinosus]
MTTEHLTGPWRAILADADGFVYPDFATALLELGAESEEEMQIRVARGTALPNDRGGKTGTLLRLPGSYTVGDQAYEIEAYLVDEDDPSIGAEARYAQALAMADGLNAAAARS